jgi:hypothetical protein
MPQTILIQPGTTLFHVSATFLGDATQWYRIAQINGITDPFPTALTLLNLPTIRTAPGQPLAGRS